MSLRPKTFQRVVLTVLVALLALPASAAACQAVYSNHPDYIVEDHQLYVSFELDHSVEITQKASISIIQDGVKMVCLTCPLRHLEVTSSNVKAFFTNGEDARIGFTTRILSSKSQIEIHFNRLLDKGEMVNVALKYKGLSPESFRSYHDGDLEYLEIQLSAKNEVPVKSMEVTVQLPMLPAGWIVNETVPYGQVLQGSRRNPAVIWSLYGVGAGEKSFKIVTISRDVYLQDEFPPILINFITMMSLMIGSVIVADVRQLRKLWRQRREESMIDEELGKTPNRFFHSKIFSLAFKNVMRKLGRTFLTLLGVAIAGAMVGSQLPIAVSAAASEGSVIEVQPYVYAMIGITLIVGFLCVTSTMISSVHERRVEIGVMKAVGISSSSIMKLFMTEALVIGLVGGATGSLIGSVWAITQNMEATYYSGSYPVAEMFVNLGFIALFASICLGNSKTSFLAGLFSLIAFTGLGVYSTALFNFTLPIGYYTTILLALLSVTFIILVSLIGGLYPAYRAAKMLPMETLR